MTDARTPGEASAVVRRLLERGLKVAVAESLTGGLLTSQLIDIPGASDAITGGVVAYDVELKHSVLGVDEDLLREKGPVDGEVACQMARGVRGLCHADIGLSTTGVAGPAPDPQTGQAVGTVWLGVSAEQGERSVLLNLDGDRDAIRRGTVVKALGLLDEVLTALDGA